MGAYRAAGNFLWFISGAPLAALLWVIIAGLLAISIVGLPWARACLSLAKFSLFPFGKDIVSVRELNGRHSLTARAVGLVANVLWIAFFGVWLALTHILLAGLNLALGVFIVTIPIVIPMAHAHMKLAGASLWPVGRRVVQSEVAEAARRYEAEAEINRRRAHAPDWRHIPPAFPVHTR